MAKADRDTPEYTPPICMQKIILAMDHQGLAHQDVNEQAGWGRQRLYRWMITSGEPRCSEIIKLARIIDRDVWYLIEDSIPMREPAPRFRDYGAMGNEDTKQPTKVATAVPATTPDEVDEAIDHLLSLREQITELTADLSHARRLIQRKGGKTQDD